MMPIAPSFAQAAADAAPTVVASVNPPASVKDLPKEIKGTVAYRLGSGDKVRLKVYNEDTLTGEYVVDGSGSISLQLIGAVQVAGKTVPEVIDLIAGTLKNGGFMLNPSVTMEVLNYRPFYVLGEIKEPGTYAYVSDMTVLNAIALAGGYTYRAQKKKVTIVSESEPDKERVAGPGDIVKPGDIIRVPERFF